VRAQAIRTAEQIYNMRAIMGVLLVVADDGWRIGGQNGADAR
jgi:hypothetical protein